VITKKICLLGTVCVGKTSLVRRFVSSTFSDRYLTTIGVKIDKKTLFHDQSEVQLVVWDIQGEDRYHKILLSYLRGLSGYVLVIDSTRRETLEVAQVLHNRVQEMFPGMPYVVVLSKCDLVQDPQLHHDVAHLGENACATLRTSALTGEGVDEAFEALTAGMLSLKLTG